MEQVVHLNFMLYLSLIQGQMVLHALFYTRQSIKFLRTEETFAVRLGCYCVSGRVNLYIFVSGRKQLKRE